MYKYLDENSYIFKHINQVLSGLAEAIKLKHEEVGISSVFFQILTIGHS